MARATEGLGRAKGSLKAELYKMLVYETGGFFLAHRDTEKAPGMLGTLIVVLPSVHEGGELVVRHDGRDTILDMRNADPGELRFAAFYADCEHEVRAVAKGHRVCLVYNLVGTSRKKGEVAAVPDTRPHVEAAAALRQWAKRKKRAEKIVYLLEHRYTEAALSFKALKGRDAALAEVLTKAAANAGCAAHLAMVHIEESGWAEYFGSYGGRRRYWDDEDDDDEDEDDFEIGEVCDGDRYIAQWRDAGDKAVDFGKIPLEDNEVLPACALDGEEADETHFSEATGNEGASFERTYLCAALVLWPQKAFDEICASAGFEATLARLEQRVDEARTDEASADARKGVRKLAGLLEKKWPEYSYGLPSDACGRAITVLVRFGDAKLLSRHMSPVLEKHAPEDIRPLLDWAELAGPEASRAFYMPSNPCPKRRGYRRRLTARFHMRPPFPSLKP